MQDVVTEKRDLTGVMSLVFAVLATFLFTPFTAAIAIFAGIVGLARFPQKSVHFYLSFAGTVLAVFMLIGWLIL